MAPKEPYRQFSYVNLVPINLVEIILDGFTLLYNYMSKKRALHI